LEENITSIESIYLVQHLLRVMDRAAGSWLNGAANFITV
jgi:hypothetical protein